MIQSLEYCAKRCVGTLETIGSSAASLLCCNTRRMVRGYGGKLNSRRTNFVSYLTMKTGSATETSHFEPTLTKVPQDLTL